MSTKTNTGDILLVEDNPDDEALTLRAFKKNGIPNTVVVARDGVEALNYLFGREQAQALASRPLPALILLDLKLPRIDGLEVLRHLRANARTATLPVVVLTTSREPRDVDAAYRLGANSYIRKPVDFEQFIETLGRIGVYWLELNEAPDALARTGGN